jgi:hypothetical protein
VVDWKSSATQLISGIVGSSLFLFGLTTFYTDYLQKPRVEISAEVDLLDPSDRDFLDYLSQGENETKRFTGSLANKSELKYEIQADIVNLGNTPATEVRVTYALLDDRLREEDNYIDAHNPLVFSQENFTTIFEHPKRVIWEIPRLAAGSTFFMNVNVTQNFTGSLMPDQLFERFPGQFSKELTSRGNELEAFQVLESFYSPNYYISVAADHGTTLRDFGSFTNSEELNEQLLSDINAAIFANAPLIFLSVVSVLIILIPQISIVIKHRRVKNEQAKMVSAVHSEIKMVHDAVEEDMSSKKIFPCKVWHSAPSDLKRQTFDNYDDYTSINNFYEELEIRDSLLTAKSEAFRIDNKELLQISDDILRKINWVKYRMIHFSVPIARTALSALAVAFSEYVIFNLVAELTPRGLPQWAPILLLTMAITGAVIAFALLARILNIQSIFSKRDNNRFKLVLPRDKKIRLIVLCLIAGGIFPLVLTILVFTESDRAVANVLLSLGPVPVRGLSFSTLFFISGTAVLIVGGLLTILMMSLSVLHMARKIKKSL